MDFDRIDYKVIKLLQYEAQLMNKQIAAVVMVKISKSGQ